MQYLACVLVFALAAASATTVVFSSFDSAALANIQLNGQAQQLNPNSGNYLRLTSAANNQVGSAFLKTTIDLSNDASFSTAFAIQMSNPGGSSDSDGLGADGIVFIINSVTNIVGSNGGGIGYSGLPKSIGIEFDTYYNSENNDVNGNHVGLDVNGNIRSTVQAAYPTRFNDGNVHYAWVDFNGATKVLEVRVADSSTRPTGTYISTTVDLLSILGTNTVFVGFSAGTGGAYENHIIQGWTFTNTFAPITVSPTAPASVCGNGAIEGSEQCDGGVCCTSSCTFASSSSVCRASAGACDVAETCSGSSASCPADSFASSSAVCRASAGVCDVAETCSGSSASCPADSFVSSSSVCRASAGACDVAETCDGSSASCPADSVASSSQVCRASAGSCDVAESCDGSSVNCPADRIAPATQVCRPAVDSCDIAESCTGTSVSCPADALSMTGPCFCSREGVTAPKPYPEYYCNPSNSSIFYMCVYGVFLPQSSKMTCGTGTTCGCPSGNECSCSATRSPCVWANTLQQC